MPGITLNNRAVDRQCHGPDRLLYALADWALVVCCEDGRGGIWARGHRESETWVGATAGPSLAEAGGGGEEGEVLLQACGVSPGGEGVV
jgi:hypothetical protein